MIWWKITIFYAKHDINTLFIANCKSLPHLSHSFLRFFAKDDINILFHLFAPTTTLKSSCQNIQETFCWNKKEDTTTWQGQEETRQKLHQMANKSYWTLLVINLSEKVTRNLWYNVYSVIHFISSMYIILISLVHWNFIPVYL